MSKIKLTGESSGYVEISAGNAAGNNTLEAPTSGTRLVAHEGSQDVTLNGNLTVNGVVSYEDVTNIDSVGVMTARSGLEVTSGGLQVVAGNVGIDQANPTNKLEVEGSASVARFVGNRTDALGPRLSLAKSRGSTSGSATIVQDGDEIGQIMFKGADGTDADSTGAAIIGLVDGTPGVNDMPGALTFLTTNDGTNSPTERLRITSVGDVGIGTNNPYAKNHIEIDVNAGAGSGSAGALWLKNANQTANNSATIFFGNNASQAAGAINFIHKDYSTNAGDITFDTRENGSTYAERLRISNTGELSISGSRSANNISDAILKFNIVNSNGDSKKAEIKAVKTSDISSELIFSTTKSHTFAERMRIADNGNIAVQNTDPSSKVHIGDLIGSVSNDANTTHTSLIIKQTNNDNKSGFYIERSGERKGYYMWMNPGGGSGDGLTFTRNNNGTKSDALILDRDANIWGGGTFYPLSDNAYDLGSSSNRWRNVYTTDLQLSNEGSQNDVDGTWGSYTIQEGEDELFLINRRNGKKYKFNLTEVN